MKSEPVLIDRIQVVNRLRGDIREETITQIMESIPRVGGLLHPIAIRYVDGFAIEDDIIDGVPVLVAGRHRLEAMRRLGRSHIDCLIFETERAAHLWEISENLHRNDLDRQQRAIHETEWMKWATEEAEEGKGVHGEQPSKNSQPHDKGLSLAARSLPIPGKTDNAKRIHLSRSKKIAENTSPEAAQAVRDAGLTNSTTALLEIADTPPELQVDKVREIVARKSQPKPKPTPNADKALSVIEAMETIAQGIVDDNDSMPPWAGEDAEFEAMKSAWNAARNTARQRFIEWAGLTP
jgi:ParB family chromosome partitioning protein